MSEGIIVGDLALPPDRDEATFLKQLLPNHIATLGPGDEAFHAHLYPGDYNVNNPLWEKLRRANAWDEPDADSRAYAAIASGIVARQIVLERLRIEPDIGSPNGRGGLVTVHDQRAVELSTRWYALAGDDVRFLWKSDFLNMVRAVVGPDNPYLLFYEQGLANGVPRGDFWKTKEAIRYQGYTDNVSGYNSLYATVVAGERLTEVPELVLLTDCVRDLFHTRAYSAEETRERIEREAPA